ncbi:MAG: SUF system Fe-S cluster assembly protein [Bacteroidetes bacterium]|nr:SUF system Fe-S cluster assembly protein [Bacteroidota bacterium]
MKNLLESQIIERLKTVFDPEIPVNIYDLGLIYAINIDGDLNVHVRMTLTSPNCPVAENLPVEVRDAVKGVEGVKEVEIELVFEPPWDTAMISEAAKLDLGLI